MSDPNNRSDLIKRCDNEFGYNNDLKFNKMILD